MVGIIRYFLFALCCLLPLNLKGDAKVTVTVNGNELSEGVPFYPRITVARENGEDIDVNSFKMDGAPIDVEFLGDSYHNSIMSINGVTQEQRLTISTYRFRVEGKPTGLHIIPPISVEVDGKTYRSSRTAYSISSAQVVASSFKLESAIEARDTIFPGQRFALIYRIYYQQDIETSLRQLPVPTGQSFRAIGGQAVENYRSGGFYIQEIRQELEALIPGEYKIGPAVIEGYIYEQDFFGRRILKQPRLRAEADPLTVKVEAFPENDRPPSFNGAVGNFSIQARLLSNYQVSVGDKMELEVTIYGEGQVESVNLPDIGRQTNFKGRFRLSDLPPTGEHEGQSKRFIVELRPLGVGIDSIPPIQFSFFDPRAKVYRTTRSEPIGINVSGLEGSSTQANSFPRPTEASREERTEGDQQERLTEPKSPEIWNENFGKVGSILIQGNYRLKEKDLEKSLLQRKEALLIIPLLLTLLMLQVVTKRRKQTVQTKKQVKSGRELYRDAVLAKNDPDTFYPSLELAFLTLLKEKHLISPTIETAADLSRGGIVGDVRTLLTMLEAQRFSGKKLLNADQIVEKAQKLFERIQ